MTYGSGASKIRRMSPTDRPKLLGVLNLSPESMVSESIAQGDAEIIARAELLHASGADWIDVGARSITPDAPMIDDATEQARLLPALELLEKHQARISVDTWSESTARVALEAGGGGINYTGGTITSETLDCVADHRATLFLTFMPFENAYEMRGAPPAPTGIPAILDHLGPKVEAARRAGIETVVIDPNLGIIHGAASDAEKIHRQLDVVWNLESLRTLGCPILLYAARKPEPLARLMMASAVLHARADYIRTHTPEMIETLRSVVL